MRDKWLVLVLCSLLLIAGCVDVEKIRVARIPVRSFEMKKGSGFDYFDIAIFDNPSMSEFDDLRIEKIINIGYEIWVRNNSQSSGQFRLYATQIKSTMDLTSTDDVIAQAPLIFTSPVIAAQSAVFIDWPGSMQYNSNQKDLFSYLDDKKATFYLIADNSEIYLDSLAVIVTASTIKK